MCEGERGFGVVLEEKGDAVQRKKILYKKLLP